jgi:phosphate acetyltransferase
MSLLLGKTAKVGYFRPIINDVEEGKKDNHVETILSHFKLDMEYNEAFAFTRSKIIKKKNKGKVGEIIDTIIEKFKNLEEKFDFVLVEGTDFVGEGTVIELDLNVLIAKNLGIPTLIVESGVGKTLDGFLENLYLAYDSFKMKDVEVLGVFANKVQHQNIELVRNSLKEYLPENVLVNVIPLIDSLDRPTMREILDELEGEVLFGEEFLNNQTGAKAVGAMQLHNYLNHIQENVLVITPGDRADLILGALQAHISANYPSISGIVLTGNIKPEESILKLIRGLSNIVPIIAVKEGTYNVTNKIGAIKSKIYAESTNKILNSVSVFENYIAVEKLANSLITFKPEGITPRMFQYNLLKRAQKVKKHIVLPEGNDDRILTAAERLLVLDVVDITILGNKKDIEKKCLELGLHLVPKKATIIKPNESDLYEQFAQSFYEMRKHKNVNLEMARDLMTDVSYFGTMMVHHNLADGMVSGAIHTTQHTIKPALQFIKTKPNTSLVSSIFFMCLEDRVSVFGDCAINPNPTASELAEIAISSADSTLAFGIEPKIAMLSYSSGTSGQGEDVDKVREATEIVKKLRPDLKIEGPIQYDAAVDMKVGKSKLPNSEVAGQASVLIFPDLNTGNNTYKAVQRETGALAIGPMLQGLNKPVNDLSRGCTTEDIFNTVILTAIQAQGL